MAIEGKALAGYWFTGGATVAERAALTLTYGLSTLAKEVKFYTSMEFTVFLRCPLNFVAAQRCPLDFVVTQSNRRNFIVRPGGNT